MKIIATRPILFCLSLLIFQSTNAQLGFEVPPLPDEDIVYHTAEGLDIKVVVVAKGLDHPWSMAFLPDGAVLVTEKNTGLLRIIRDDALDPEPVAGIPQVSSSGLLDVVLHPDFIHNQFIYLSYVKPVANSQTAIGIARGRWDGQALQDTHDIFVTQAGIDTGSRIVFDHDGLLYFSTFGGGENAAQDPSNHFRKVLRITDEGEIPENNPFLNVEDAQPEIFTLGHRSILGLALHEESGDIWQIEMGPNGGDEVNILIPGGNYGWPLVSLGRSYAGPWRAEQFQLEGYQDPVIYWTPSVSISGMAFYTGDKFPQWQGNLFVGGMRTGEIPGTGQLQRVLFNANMEELRREALLVDLRRRIRDVRQSPDGYLYVATDEDDGAVLRIEPL